MNPILRLISAHARMYPEKPAILLADQLVNYGMLENSIVSLAQRIRSENLRKDRPIGICIDNPFRQLAVCLALLKLGIPGASLSPESFDAACDLGMTDLICDPPCATNARLTQHVVRNDWFHQQRDHYWADGDLDVERGRVVHIIFSSGTTGKPKAIGYTEDALFGRISDRMWKFGAQPWDRALCMAGLASEAGLTYSLFALCLGRTVSFARGSEEALQMLSLYGIEQIRASPGQLRDLVTVAAKKPTPLPRLNSVHSGGGPLSNDLLNAVSSTLCRTVVDSYGSTEAGTAGIAFGALLQGRGDSPPCFFPIVEVECVGDDGSPVEKGAEGRIRIRSKGMGWPFDGNLFPDPIPWERQWFHPGDVGYINESGLLVWLGRSDDLINVGGHKISPELVEDHLRAHPRIIDVAIVRAGAANAELQRWVAAIVFESEVTPAQLREWCAKSFPFVEIASVMRMESIPRTEFGKVNREMLRKIFAAQ